ncbi:hypothetical protein ACMFMG_004655 [Clarireedia jacksonii]
MAIFEGLDINVSPHASGRQATSTTKNGSNLSNPELHFTDEPRTSTSLFLTPNETPRRDCDHISSNDESKTHNLGEQYSTPTSFQELHEAKTNSSSPVEGYEHSIYGNSRDLFREYSRSHSKEALPRAESCASPLGSPRSFTHFSHSPSPTLPTLTADTDRTISSDSKKIFKNPSPPLSPPTKHSSPAGSVYSRNPIAPTPPAPEYPTARAAIIEITILNLNVLRQYLYTISDSTSVLIKSSPNLVSSSSHSTLTPIISLIALLSKLTFRIEALRPYPDSYYYSPSPSTPNFINFIVTRPSALHNLLYSQTKQIPSIQALMKKAVEIIGEDIWSFCEQHIHDCAQLKRGARTAVDDRLDTVMKVLRNVKKEFDRYEEAMGKLGDFELQSEASLPVEGSVTITGSESGASIRSENKASQQIVELSDKLDRILKYLGDMEENYERYNGMIEKLSKKVLRLERSAR